MMFSETIFSPGLILAFLLATAYGTGFHLFFGGPLRRLFLFLLASWMGFALGQWVGVTLGLRVMNIGPIYTLTASLGSWLALLFSHWLGKEQHSTQNKSS